MLEDDLEAIEVQEAAEMAGDDYLNDLNGEISFEAIEDEVMTIE
jgi:hypothetical protein